MIINREELAWAAGFFDGEGYVGVVKAGKRHKRMALHVHQTDPRPLLRFRNALGFGILAGPYDNKNGSPNRRPHYRYYVTSFMEVQAIVALLWTWLSEPKKQQAKQALLDMKEYAKTLTNKRGKRNCYTQKRNKSLMENGGMTAETLQAFAEYDAARNLHNQQHKENQWPKQTR